MNTPTQVAVLPRPVSRWRFFLHNRASVLGAVVFASLALLAAFGMLLAPYDPASVGVGPSMTAPSAQYWMGTDELGRDVFSRVLAGIKVSLFVGVSAAAAATLIGVAVGALAGFFSGWIDDVLSRVTEVFQVIPRFFLAILLVAFFGASLLNLIFAIAILSWPELARIVRAEFLTLKTRQFVDAARVAGAGRFQLMFTEILPNALGPVIVNSTLQVGQAMLLEAGLSYLGLGDPSEISLGIMLHQAQQIMRTAWWATAFPGLMIFLAVLSINLMGDGLNDVLNPRSRER